METIEAINLITRNPGIRNGRPIIADTGIEVSVIAIAKIAHGQTPEEIAAEYALTLPQVYAALAYYYDHKAQVDATIQERRKLAQAMKENRIGSRHQPLFG